MVINQNDVPLRDYLDMRIAAVEVQITQLSKFVEQHFVLNETAISKAEEAMKLRLDGMNQFREQLNQERGHYVARDLCDKQEDSVDKRLKLLERNQSFGSGKLWMVMAFFAVIPTILAIIALFTR